MLADLVEEIRFCKHCQPDNTATEKLTLGPGIVLGQCVGDSATGIYFVITFETVFGPGPLRPNRTCIRKLQTTVGLSRLVGQPVAGTDESTDTFLAHLIMNDLMTTALDNPVGQPQTDPF